MTAEQKRLVQDSFTNIRESAEPIGLLFYGRLFALDPALRELFTIDIRLQTRKLMAMLQALIDALDDFDRMRPALLELGNRHANEFHVRPEHYETLKQALLWALAQALEGQFYDEVREAWSALITEVNRAMLS